MSVCVCVYEFMCGVCVQWNQSKVTTFETKTIGCIRQVVLILLCRYRKVTLVCA